MKKQTADTIRIEAEQAGWRPILAKVKEGDKWTWQIWGINPKTQEKMFIVSREQWEQVKHPLEVTIHLSAESVGILPAGVELNGITHSVPPGEL